MTDRNYFWDGYLDWAATIETARLPVDPHSRGRLNVGDGAFYEPVFIQLAELPGLEALNAIAKFLDDGPTSPDGPNLEQFAALTAIAEDDDFIIDLRDLYVGVEHSLMSLRLDRVPPVPLEFTIYRRFRPEAQPADGKSGLFTVIDVGAAALIQKPTWPIVTKWNKGLIPIRKIGAVIDNDIGFLNRRFRVKKGDIEETRFEAVWLQAREMLSEDTAQPGTIALGRVIRKRSIDRWLANPVGGERDYYKAVNTELHELAAFKEPPKNDTHGTAVADAAFGLDPDAVPQDPGLPLLAVQLPPEASVDTTGTHSESYIVQAVRWLCSEARNIEPMATLVINLSYGVVAGAKDGSTFLEAQIKREVELARMFGQQVEVVYAYGNARNARQVAQVDVPAKGTSQALTWVLQPDSRLPAFMELRQLGEKGGEPTLVDMSSEISVKLTPPGNQLAALEAKPAWGTAVPPMDPATGAAPYRVYAVPGRSQSPRPKTLDYYCIGLAPTRRFADDIAPATPGDWTVELINTGDTDVTVVLQIQRGDRAPGTTFGGRQSFFEGAFRYSNIEGHIARDVVAPLTNEGCNSRYTTAVLDPSDGGGALLSVGAKQAVPGGAVPADYSAQGAPWLLAEGPTHWEVVDRIGLSGVSVTGTYSGTRSRLSGTSGAAALRSRAQLGLAPF